MQATDVKFFQVEWSRSELTSLINCLLNIYFYLDDKVLVNPLVVKPMLTCYSTTFIEAAILAKSILHL